MAKFEKVSKYKNADLAMPVRKTKYSAGYDMVAAEDYVIPSCEDLITKICFSTFNIREKDNMGNVIPLSLDEMGKLTKELKAKPSLVSTGMKCKLADNEYLELSVRSSSPLKYWIILANGVGIIDADYYNNPDNEGEIFFQLINLSPYPLEIKKGEAIGQGIIHKYEVTEDDNASGLREGGFGSTTNAAQPVLAPAT